jgi:hypothetical protein
MAFSMDGIVIDRIQYGIAEDFSGNVLYTLTQLADAEIAITAESKEARDATGTLIKKFYTGKAGTFTANNAILDFNILAEATGTPKQIAGAGEAAIIMPGVKTVKVGTESVELAGVVEGTVSVIGIAGNGTMVKNYVLAEDFQLAEATLTLPTEVEGVTEFVVKYDRKVESGLKIVNKADEFPRTIKLTLKALAVDVCNPDVLRSVLIVLPSFQVSPETNLSLTTDAQLQYSGDLQVSYCGTDGKVLYEIYFAEEDVE